MTIKSYFNFYIYFFKVIVNLYTYFKSKYIKLFILYKILDKRFFEKKTKIKISTL